jgi:hypothetical protein
VSWTTVSAQIGVVLWTSLALDQVQRANSFLTDSTLSVTVAWNNLLIALTLFDPVDANNNWLLGEPMRPVRSQLKITNVPNVGFLATGFEIVWNQKVTGQVSV